MGLIKCPMCGGSGITERGYDCGHCGGNGRVEAEDFEDFDFDLGVDVHF